MRSRGGAPGRVRRRSTPSNTTGSVSAARCRSTRLIRSCGGIAPRAHAAAPLATVSVPDTYERLDDIDADTFLRDINFPDAARHLAFEVFARSFFARPEKLSAAELVTMFHIYFLGSSEGLLFDVANANFDVALWNPLQKYLESRGVRFHTGRGSRRPDRGLRPRGWHAATDAGFAADAVVLATDVAGLRRIVAGSPGLGDEDWRHRVADLHTAPPFVVLRLWLDRRVTAIARHSWAPVAARRWTTSASWSATNAKRADGRPDRRIGRGTARLLGDRPDDDVRDAVVARMHELYPETVGATIVDERLLRRDDCPRFAPGDFGRRPAVETPDRRWCWRGTGFGSTCPWH